jgi:two-component system, sensor histidine kinase and response regulator
VLPDSDILDLSRLVEAFEDDTAGIAELLDMALETGAKHRAALAEGIVRGDAEVVRRAAHSIKGSAGNIGANAVMHDAAALEERARAGDLEDARERAAAIDAGYARVAAEVKAYRASLGS